MKRLRLGRWSAQLLAARPVCPSQGPSSCPAISSSPAAAAAALPKAWKPGPQFHPVRYQSSSAAPASPEIVFEDSLTPPTHFPSPLPERALSSAKLAALHARLSLSERIPLQTLARTLIDPSADDDPRFNNTNLAFLGSTLLGYHTTESLVCQYPRLPFTVLCEAARAYSGPESLAQVARSWGVESVAAPGDEVDPGLLQFSVTKPRPEPRRWAVPRPAYIEKYNWRRGINSRVVMDDEFGDPIQDSGATAEGESSSDLSGEPLKPWQDKKKTATLVHADFVRAVVGAVYAHCGREAAKSFVKAHVLSRHLNIASLFSFKLPTRELARLCKREGFDAPVARLLSETGRLSRTPAIVVGIYSGNEKLGEGVGPNPHEARAAAAMNALKAWYLYSPGPQFRVPSDMFVEGAKPWEPAYVDIGEVL